MRHNKYGNEYTVKNGRRYQSKKEANRAQELMLLQHAGEIRELEEQVNIPLYVNGILIGFYRSDFTYYKKNLKKKTIEDSKGYKTDLFKWKWRHAQAEYPEWEFVTS